MCCEVFHHAMVYDQLNLGNLASLEAIARELQIQELRWADRVGGGESESERSIITGSVGYGNLCVMPAIRGYLSDQLRITNDREKERRKAREERGLQKPPKVPKA